jgi:aconitate hydratase
VIAQSFERIHRSNLVGMGVLPLQFADGQSAQSLGLSGEETFAIDGIADAVAAVAQARGGELTVAVRAERDDAQPVAFDARLRIDTPREAEYFHHGGILQFVLRTLLAA